MASEEVKRFDSLTYIFGLEENILTIREFKIIELQLKKGLERQSWWSRVVLQKGQDGNVRGIGVDLRKEMCPRYLAVGCHPSFGQSGQCLRWHICKRFLEGDCKGGCHRSHDFCDKDNRDKTEQFGLEKFPRELIRRIVSYSLPQVCLLYLRSKCDSDECPYLHICSSVIRKTACDCDLLHNNTDLNSHNKEILERHGLCFELSTRITDFALCSILVPVKQRIFKSSEDSFLQNQSYLSETPSASMVNKNVTSSEFQENRTCSTINVANDEAIHCTPSSIKKQRGETTDKQQQNQTGMHLNKIRSSLITHVSKKIPQVFEADDESSPSSPHSIEQELKTDDGHRLEDFNVSDTQGISSHFIQLSPRQKQDELLRKRKTKKFWTDSALFSDGWDPFKWSKTNVTSPDAKSIPETIGEKDSAQISASSLAIVKERQQIFERQKETEILPSKKTGSSWATQDFKTTFASPSHSSYSTERGSAAGKEHGNNGKITPSSSDSSLTLQVLESIPEIPSSKNDVPCSHPNSHSIGKRRIAFEGHEKKEKMQPSSSHSSLNLLVFESIPEFETTSATDDRPSRPYKTSRIKEGETAEESWKKEKMQPGRSDKTSSPHDSKIISETHDDKPNHFNQRSGKKEGEAIMRHRNKEKMQQSSLYSTLFAQDSKNNSEIPRGANDTTSYCNQHSIVKQEEEVEGQQKKKMQPNRSNTGLTLQDFLIPAELPSARKEEIGHSSSHSNGKETETVLSHQKQERIDPSSLDNTTSSQGSKSIPQKSSATNDELSNLCSVEKIQAVDGKRSEEKMQQSSNLSATKSILKKTSATDNVLSHPNPCLSEKKEKDVGGEEKKGSKLPSENNSANKRDRAKRSETDHWSSMKSGEKYKRVKLDPNSVEFKDVEQKFRCTMTSDHVIDTIERVQNPFLWRKYRWVKKDMAKYSSQHKAEEKRLFHGTNPKSVPTICRRNFDWRLSGEHGHNFGYGSYFARDASYSHSYAKKDGGYHHFMILARVLIGSYTRGESSYRTPPAKEPSNPDSDLYDSCVNNTINPTIFVIFDKDQCYPEYIIKYFTLENFPTLSRCSPSLQGANSTTPGYTQRNLANSGVYKSILKNTSCASSLHQTVTTPRNSQGIPSTSLGVSSKSLEAKRGLASSTLNLQQLNAMPTNSQGVLTNLKGRSKLGLSSQRVLSISTPNLLGSPSSSKKESGSNTRRKTKKNKSDSRRCLIQ